MTTPYPGSTQARAHGCPCPPQDHEHTTRWPWWIRPECPVHGWKEFQENT